MASRRKKPRVDYADSREEPSNFDSDDSMGDPNFEPPSSSEDDVFPDEGGSAPTAPASASSSSSASASVPAQPSTSGSQRPVMSKFLEYFEIAAARDSATCKICTATNKREKILKMSQRSTSGMKKHLQRQHPKEFNRLFPEESGKTQSKQQTLTSLLGKRKADSNPIGSTVSTATTNENFKEKIVDWIACKGEPLSFFDDKKTQDFFKALNKEIEYPGRNAMRTLVLKRYKSLQQAVIKLLAANKSKISFTVDGWTSICGKGFYGITAHFIDEEWNLRSIVLDFIPAHGKHSGKDIAEFFKKSLQNHGILDRVQGITVDNAAVNTTFLEELSKFVPGFDAENSHFRCFGHIINLSVQDLMKNLFPSTLRQDEISDYRDEDESDNEESEDDEGEMMSQRNVLERIRGIFKKIKRSEQLCLRYEAACKTLDIKPKKVVLDVATRWNSTFAMINHAIEVKGALNFLCDNDSTLKEFKVSESEWATLKSIESLLKNCKKVSDKLGGEKYVTLPSVVMYVNLLLDFIDKKIENEDSNEVKNALIVARNKIVKHYNKTNWVYCVSMALDPRHKLEIFDSSSWGADLKSETQSRLRQIYNKYKEEYEEDYPADCVDETAKVSSTSSEDDLHLHSLYKKKAPLSDELDRYLKEDTKWTSNILTWWKDNEKNFPILSRMARDFLSTPATSVPAERLFSKAGQILRKQRNRLGEELANALLCLQSWTKDDFLDVLKQFL